MPGLKHGYFRLEEEADKTYGDEYKKKGEYFVPFFSLKDREKKSSKFSVKKNSLQNQDKFLTEWLKDVL